MFLGIRVLASNLRAGEPLEKTHLAKLAMSTRLSYDEVGKMETNLGFFIQ